MDHEKPPRRPTTVKFARKTSSGRYVSLSREDLDNMNYMVQMPPTPDNQSTIDEEEEASVGSSGPLFGGIPRPDQRVNKIVHESEIGNSQIAESRSSMCSMPECERAIIQDGGGFDIHPCECSFNICCNCYLNVQKEGGTCPSCKEPYKIESYDTNRNPIMSTIPQQEDWMASKRIPVMKRSETVDSDQSWLYEMQGTYDYSSAFWSKDGTYNADSIIEEELQEGIERRSEKSWKPLTRKIPMSTAIISPYRLLVLIRLVALTLFLAWRVKHPNEDAIWLWAMSVVCEIWFAFSWILDQVPKLSPVNRSTDLSVLQEKFEAPNTLSDLPGVDVFVSTADPEKEPPLVTANTILSILAADYPVEKLACYISDDGGALLTFEAMAEAASFASLWVPFCRKHEIEPRNPDSYFGLKRDPTKNKMRSDFVRDRRKVKREYDEFKVRVNGLTDSIRRRSDAYNAREEMKVLRKMRESGRELEVIKASKATWMADGTYWPGTWVVPGPDHSRGDHASILQVMVEPPAACSPVLGMKDEESGTDLTGVDIRLPMLVYVSREKRPGYDHNKKAGAMNALVRVSAVLSNGPFILNLDCDHYIYNTQAIREGMCFMMDRGGESICYIQFPQRFEGIDPSDRYANHNTVFFDGNMRALDGVQGPMYVGTGCIFRRFALYGFDPPMEMTYEMTDAESESEIEALKSDSFSSDIDMSLMPKRFGNSVALVESIPIAEFQGRPLADHPGVKHGRPPGALRAPRPLLDPGTVAEAVSVISCWYEDKTEWGDRVGWIYGSVTEDVVTGYRMHNRGWHSVYCITKRDAFRGSAPINLTDRLHQVLRWATGSVEIFFSRNNALIATSKMKFLQRIAYLNVGIYPFTSFFLLVYCFLPALSLFSGQFIVQTLNVTFLIYLLTITITLTLLAILEVKWSGVGLEEWWRNEQFWLISGTSAHLYAVVQGLLKVIAGIEISFTLTSKSAASENDDVDIYADLYVVKWTSLMVPPITIMMVNLIAVAVGFARTIYSTVPEWSKLLGGGFFSFWVLVHLYPFAKGLMGKRGQTPTIVFVWSGLIAITISLLWVAINPPNNKYQGALLSSGGL